MKPDELELLEKEMRRLANLLVKELNFDLEVSALSLQVILDIGYIKITRNVIFTDHRTVNCIILSNREKSEWLFEEWKRFIQLRNKISAIKNEGE